MKIYITDWSPKYGYCVWYNEPLYLECNPLIIFAKWHQLRDFYYKNFTETVWNYK